MVMTEFILESVERGDIDWDLELAETPLYTGRVIAALAAALDRSVTRSEQIFHEPPPPTVLGVDYYWVVLTEIWRYPVKSMSGEPLIEAEVSPAGLIGDRTWAVVDTETGLVASAKHPRRWAALLGCQSTLDADGETLSVVTAHNNRFTSEGLASANDALSGLVGRSVELKHRRELGGGHIERTDPSAETFAATGPLDLDEIAGFQLGTAAPESLFDFAALHIVTTATLAAISEQVDAEANELRARFRPNFVIDIDCEPFDENDWPNRELMLGDLACDVVLPTPRCIVPTLAQPGFGPNPEVARTLARINRIDIPGFGRLPVAGVYVSPQATASVKVGDQVTVRP